MITEYLVAALVKEMFPKGGMFSKKTITADALAEALGGLLKAVFLDMDLAISVYIDEAEAAKKVAQAEAIAAERKTVSDVFGTALESVADKDMTRQIDADLRRAALQHLYPLPDKWYRRLLPRLAANRLPLQVVVAGKSFDLLTLADQP